MNGDTLNVWGGGVDRLGATWLRARRLHSICRRLVQALEPARSSSPRGGVHRLDLRVGQDQRRERPVFATPTVRSE